MVTRHGLVAVLLGCLVAGLACADAEDVGAVTDPSQPFIIGSGHTPVWSPTGDRVAYWQGSVRVYTLATGATESVKTASYGDMPPSWLPDGSGLMGVCPSRAEKEGAVTRFLDPQLHLLPLGEKEPEAVALTRFERRALERAAVSPDGRWAVVECYKQNSPYTYETMQSIPGVIPDLETKEGFEIVRRPYRGLCLVDLQTGQQEVLMEAEKAFEQAPRFTGDSSAIIFSRLTGNLDQTNEVGPEWNIARYDLATKTISPIVRTGKVSIYTVSRDGTRLAYLRFGGPNDLWVVNTDGTRMTQISTNDRYPAKPNTLNWTPDGKCILYQCGDIICGVGLDRSGSFPLTGDLQIFEGYGYNFDIHPDGKRIVYARKDGNIVIMPLDWSQAPAHLRPE